MIEELKKEICPNCGHDLWHHENYSDGFAGTLFGECLEENCECKHP